MKRRVEASNVLRLRELLQTALYDGQRGGIMSDDHIDTSQHMHSNSILIDSSID